MHNMVCQLVQQLLSIPYVWIKGTQLKSLNVNLVN